MKKFFLMLVLLALYNVASWSQVSITPQTVLNQSSFVGKAAPSKLFSISGSVSITPVYVMIFDTNSGIVPADGAVSPNICLGPFSASSPFSIAWNGPAVSINNGLIIVMSSTGCTTKTAANVTSLTVNVQ